MSGKVITFYSYKGGVGRTFLLANCAALLAKWGFRVLCLDWDLDAPGLVDYFREHVQAGPRVGILDLVLSFRDPSEADWKRMVRPVVIPDARGRLDLIEAGHSDSDGYGKQLAELDWRELYANHDMGQGLESLRQEWIDAYDFVLVDSRTGLTDVGGICTAQLPDVVVFLFAPHKQGLEGSIRAMQYASNRRRVLAVDRGDALLLPIPSRVDPNGLPGDSAKWLRVFSERLSGFYHQWRHEGVSSEDLLAHLKIPYVSRWSYGEPLPVLEERIDESSAVTYSIATVAAFLARLLDDSAKLVSDRSSYVQEVVSRGRSLLDPTAPRSFPYQVFLSYPREELEFAKELFEELARRGVSAWMDRSALQSGVLWAGKILEGIRDSRALVAVVGKELSHWQGVEIETFAGEAETDPARTLFHVWRKERLSLPRLLKNHQGIDAKGRTAAEVASRIRDALLPASVIRPDPVRIEMVAPPVQVFTDLLPVEAVALEDNLVLVPQRPLEAYRAWVREQHSHLIPYFREAGERLLEEVFVELDVHEEAQPREKRMDALERRSTGSALRDLLLEKANDGAARWAIQGEPGSGKTTLARSLAHSLAREEGPVPVFVSLARVQDPDAFDPIAWVVHDSVPAEESSRRQDLETELRARAEAEQGVVLLLDGLDEVAPEKIDPLCARIEVLAQKHPRAPIALLTRPIALERRELTRKFRRARIQPLDDLRRKRLLEKFLGATEAQQLGAYLAERPALLDLGRNPLLLTLIAVVARDTLLSETPLPANRSQLYGTAIDLLLRRGYGIENKAVRDRVAARRILQRMSHRLHDAGGESWTREELSDVVTAIGKEDSDLDYHLIRTWERSNDCFLDDIGLNSGILGPHDGRGAPWRYLHRSLREFLVAETLATLPAVALDARIAAWKKELDEAAEARTEATTAPVQRADPSRWGEVFTLLAGIVPRPLSVLEAIRKASPKLALRALPAVEVLGVGEGMEFLLATEGWDAFDLLRCARSWRARPETLRNALWNHLTPDRDNDELGQIAYVLERFGAGIEAEHLFAKARPELPAPPSLEYASIPAGTFRMGSESGDRDERPVHSVSVPAFELARTPVTQAHLGAFREATSRKSQSARRRTGADDFPANNVSWWEAWLFCKWIGARLPSESEWEYACRAGTTTAYWSGDEEKDLARVGWYRENSKNTLQPIAKKSANPWGLYDVHGNVWEWCEDTFHQSYEGAPKDGSAWVDEASGLRVLRGGSFVDTAEGARSAYRDGSHPSYRWGNVGFRPARSVTTD